jgi:hypothetical protein
VARWTDEGTRVRNNWSSTSLRRWIRIMSLVVVSLVAVASGVGAGLLSGNSPAGAWRPAPSAAVDDYQFSAVFSDTQGRGAVPSRRVLRRP